MNISGWLERLRNRRASRGSRAAVARRIEAVESRQLPSVVSLFIAGEVNVSASADEDIVVRPSTSNPGDLEVLVNGVPDSSLGGIALTEVTSIVIDGGDEANDIDVSAVTALDFPNLAAIVIDGSNGDDTITGSPDLGDNIDAGDGEDSITDAGGPNTLFGGDGNDTIVGGIGNDQLAGEDGDDSITGGLGNDSIDGGDGTDVIDGNDGDDAITGGDHDDSIHGNAGNDTINGEMGFDELFGDDGNDSVLGGTLNDSLLGGAGNDTLSGNAGLDTLDGGTGDDVLKGDNGDDVLLGGDGNDQLNGMNGNDTLVGNSGSDALFGGANSDCLFGDDSLAGTGVAGNDTLQGQAGDDTLIGGNGIDSLLGGIGNDLVRSTFDEAVTVSPTPPAPVPPVLPPPGTPVGLPNAIDSGAGLDSGTVHDMSSGSGDGALQISVNATGQFGGASGVNGANADAKFDPVGTAAVSRTAFESNIYFRFNTTTGARQSLTQAATNVSTIRGLTDEANSTFQIASLTFALTQDVIPINDATGARIGSLLVQSYHITNAGVATSNFEMVRYLDGDMRFDGTFSNSGGGRVITPDGDEVLLETDSGSLSAGTTFLGMTARGGQAPTTNRYEIDSFNGLQQRILQGGALDGQLTGDLNGDGSIDTGYDVTMALRNTFSLAPGADALYSTHTFFSTSVPNNVGQFNQPPAANPDGAINTLSGTPVTIDVVSNDTDADGVLDYSTVAIATPPVNGTAVSLGNGLVQYTPSATLVGTDSFTYTIRDDDGTISNAATVTITVLPTDTQGDLLNGGDDQDVIVGGQGNDTLNGMAGNDSLNGAGGNDLVFGGSGNDALRGGDGNDTLNGQSGLDTLNGDAGDDRFVWMGAADGSDVVQSSQGADTVEVNGTSVADVFAIGQSGSQLQVRQGAAAITVLNSLIQPASVVAVVVNAFGGNDTVTLTDINNVGALIVTANGGNGNDLLTANVALLGSVRLAFNGEAGNDTLVGSAEGDTLRGGDGDDIIGGGAGNDTIDAGNGLDSVNANAGDDSILGGAGNDTLLGDLGNDVINGQSEHDSIDGGDGNDTLSGEDGNDTLNGMDGHDSLSGGIGQDTAIGGAGNDTLDGGRNDDFVQGNDGDDKLRGNHGNDTLKADGGNDTINGGDGDDFIEAGLGNDGIDAEDGNDTVNAGAGNDTVLGGDGNDALMGGGGNDLVLGGDGDDAINGQSGTDTVAGNQGNDSIADLAGEVNEQFVVSAALLDILEAL